MKYLNDADIARLATFSPFWPNALEQLQTRSHQLSQQAEGMHAQTKKSSASPGEHSQFREYKPYIFGDELKRVDWKRYAKTDELYVKRYESQKRKFIRIFVDTRPSMSFAGFETRQVPMRKYDLAARLAAGLAYLFLKQHDHVQICRLSSDFNIEASDIFVQLTQLAQIDHILVNWSKAMESMSSDTPEKTSFLSAQADFNFMLTDLMPISTDKQTGRDPLTKLFESFTRIEALNHPDCCFCHILHPQELQLPNGMLKQPAKLIPRQSGHAIRLHASPQKLIAAYKQKRLGFTQTCKDWIVSRHQIYVPCYRFDRPDTAERDLFAFLQVFREK